MKMRLRMHSLINDSICCDNNEAKMFTLNGNVVETTD